MGNYASNHTARLRVKYTSAGVEHTTTLRVPDSLVLSVDMVALVNAYFTLWAPFCYTGSTIDSIKFAPKLVDYFVPVTFAGNTFGGLTPVTFGAVRAVEGTVSGLSVDGIRAKFCMFGLGYAFPTTGDLTTDYKIKGSEDAFVTALTSGINSLGLVTVSGSALYFVYDVITVKPNDYWVRQLRRVG